MNQWHLELLSSVKILAAWKGNETKHDLAMSSTAYALKRRFSTLTDSQVSQGLCQQQPIPEASSSTPECTRDPPCIGLLITIVQGLQPLLLLLFAQLSGIGDLEESWCKFHQPAWVNGGHFTHIFFCGQHQFMIHHPVGREGSTDARWRGNTHFLTERGSLDFISYDKGSSPSPVLLSLELIIFLYTVINLEEPFPAKNPFSPFYFCWSTDLLGSN